MDPNDPNCIRRCPDPADPDRCQAMTSRGQCSNFSVEAGNFCMAHGGNNAVKKQAVADKRNYALGKWQQQVGDKADAPQIKSLREEIGIMRVLLEVVVRKCDGAVDIILQAGPIGDMILKIERLVTSCHKIESSMGQLLDKAELLKFAGAVVQIIGDEVEDEATIGRISDKILASLNED